MTRRTLLLSMNGLCVRSAVEQAMSHRENPLPLPPRRTFDHPPVERLLSGSAGPGPVPEPRARLRFGVSD
ncbi:MAG: hypothetical protein ABSA63_08110 [Thermoplasmata archaeon]